MVIVDAACSTQKRPAVTANIPRESQSRRKVVCVARKSLLYIYCVLRSLYVCRRQRDPCKRIGKRCRSDLVGQLHVITHPEIERKVLGDLPRVLNEKR